MTELALSPLAFKSVDKLTPLREAIPDSVSPALTVWVEDEEEFDELLLLLDEDFDPELEAVPESAIF